MKIAYGLCVLALSTVATLAHGASASLREVNVVVDATPSGRRALMPEPGRPLFYYPVIRGYQTIGEIVGNEREPDPNFVSHAVAGALAKAGYVMVSAAHHEPDQILVISWGTLRPKSWEINDGWHGVHLQLVDRTRAGLAMVAGARAKDLDMDFQRAALLQRAEENRYFIVVTAYDAATYEHGRKKAPLWQAKMSLPSNGIGMGQAVHALAFAAVPYFGREAGPTQIMTHTTVSGTVDIGTSTVEGLLP